MDILERALELCPELAPPDLRDKDKLTLSDFAGIFKGVGCGLRPARNGGLRLETEWHAVPNKSGQEIPVIHNYG